MLIRQERILNVERHLGFISDGTNLIIGVSNVEQQTDKLRIAGFSTQLEAGEIILPAARFGPVSRFNANGKFLIHKDQPMETAYRMVEWHWKEWRGRGDTEEMTDWVNVPYKRYPRTFISPPSVELRVVITEGGNRIIVAGPYQYCPEKRETIRHVINLFLEMFGECEVLDANLGHILHSPLKRLNWRVLPPGRYPWEQLEKQLRPFLARVKQGNQALIQDRFKTVNEYQPEFHAIGEGGFTGYVVFGFPAKGLYILESNFIGNATYIFEDQWEELSKLTKAEVLDEHLQKDRIVHLKGWHSHVKALLS